MRTRLSLTICLVLFASNLLFPRASQAAWALDGMAIGAAANDQEFPTIVADGSGGAFIAWEDYRSGAFPDIYVQHVNAAGVAQWPANGVAICTAPFNQTRPSIVADGSGGAIIAWGDDRAAANNYDIYVQRVNAAGVVQWTANGVAVCTAVNHQEYPMVVPDGAGGAIMMWRDQRAASFTYHVYAQRVNASGVPQWTSNGVAIYNTTTSFGSWIISDGTAGAIVAWSNATTDLYAQRVNAAGVAQWTSSGAAICTAANSQLSPQIVLDGSGGAIFTWNDNRSGTSYDIYAQRVNASGSPQWTANGVALCTAANDQVFPEITTNGAGGAIVAWADNRTGSGGTYYDIYAQQVTASGTVPWTTNGVALCTAAYEQSFQRIVSDAAGGAIVTWQDLRVSSPFPTSDIYAQRVNNGGAVQWTANGVAICIPGSPVAPVIASNSVGGAIIAWQDGRGATYDVYAQRVEKKYGYWGRPDGWITSANDVPGDQGGHVMVVWDASDRDVFPAQEISHYTLWRELGTSAVGTLASSVNDNLFIDPSSIGPEFTGKAFRTTTGGATAWEFIATIPIRYATEYGFNATTLADSLAGNSADATYQVLTHTTNAFVFYEGNLFTGHSVDNLAPAAPTALMAQRVGSDVNLTWNRVHAPDLKNYSVFRSTSPGVTPETMNFLASSNDTVLVDSGAPTSALYYVVTAHDVHDNQGPTSNEAAITPATDVGNLPAIKSFMVLQNRPNPFATVTAFQIGLPTQADVSLEVFDVAGRRVRVAAWPRQAAGWQQVSFDGRDNTGRALASGVYFCRMSASGISVTRKIVITR